MAQQPSTSDLSRRTSSRAFLQFESDSDVDAGGLVYDAFSDDDNLNFWTCMRGEEGTNESAMPEGIGNDGTESVISGERVIKEELPDADGRMIDPLSMEDLYANIADFSWSEDYSKFSGQQEPFLCTPGPRVSNEDPLKLFKEIWDESIMERIVKETNRYAWQTIAPLSETEGGIPEYLYTWYETTIDEMYRYFAIVILMSFCDRGRVNDYWVTNNPTRMPEFGKVMSRNRYQILTRFLHFVDNDQFDPFLPSYDKKILKIRPLLDHCNRKFASMYAPDKYLSMDESLLLWKGRLNWVQCIRTKAARFGIKMYILYEAVTGYQLKCLIYAGKNSFMHEKSIHGFENITAKIVLKLMDGYLDIGHTLVMDNWYNQLPLTRFLKRRKTDVIGTINPRAQHIPEDIKRIKNNDLKRGERIARHCGDISIVSWQDIKLVTTVSTYHKNNMVRLLRARNLIQKPESVADYNKYMGGVDMKDQKLSMFLMERKRGMKWYMKVFKRLLNTSLLNAYILYQKNPTTRRSLTHRDYRLLVALALLEKHPQPKSKEIQARSVHVLPFVEKRLEPLRHFPMKTGEKNGRRLQQLCHRCTALGKKTKVTTYCRDCEVGLCLDDCWLEYHTLIKLK